MADDTSEQAEVPAGGEIIDLDQVEQTEPAKDEGEKPEPEEGEKPETAEKDDGEGGDDAKPRSRSGIQRLKTRNSHLMQELSARERELDALRSRTATANDDQNEKEPQEADFNGDYFAYQRALTAYDTRKVIREENRNSQVRDIDRQRAEVMRERIEAHQERVEAAKETFKDYDQVVSSAPQVSAAVGEEILSSDKSELLAYHLAKHPEKISALNNMTGRELAREIGRLEGIVQAPSAKKQTSAPPPPSRMGGGANPVSQDSVLDAWLKKTYG